MSLIRTLCSPPFVYNHSDPKRGMIVPTSPTAQVSTCNGSCLEHHTHLEESSNPGTFAESHRLERKPPLYMFTSLYRAQKYNICRMTLSTIDYLDPTVLDPWPHNPNQLFTTAPIRKQLETKYHYHRDAPSKSQSLLRLQWPAVIASRTNC